MALQFSPEAKARIQKLGSQYPEKHAALLPVLHLAQEEFGHLSHEVQLLVSGELDVPPVRVREVVTFYEMFHEHAEGQFHLEVCTNIACHLAGAEQLMAHAKKSLGIEIGHQTEDGVFSLMEVECLASCGSGPTMRLGFDYYEHITPPAFDALVTRCRKLAPTLNGKAYKMDPATGPHTGPFPGFEPKPPPEASPLAKDTLETPSPGATGSLLKPDAEPDTVEAPAPVPAKEKNT